MGWSAVWERSASELGCLSTLWQGWRRFRHQRRPRVGLPPPPALTHAPPVPHVRTVSPRRVDQAKAVKAIDERRAAKQQGGAQPEGQARPGPGPSDAHEGAAAAAAAAPRAKVRHYGQRQVRCAGREGTWCACLRSLNPWGTPSLVCLHGVRVHACLHGVRVHVCMHERSRLGG